MAVYKPQVKDVQGGALAATKASEFAAKAPPTFFIRTFSYIKAG